MNIPVKVDCLLKGGSRLFLPLKIIIRLKDNDSIGSIFMAILDKTPSFSLSFFFLKKLRKLWLKLKISSVKLIELHAS
jgi:hypothetical protein